MRTQPLGPLPLFFCLCARARVCVREKSFAINFMVTAALILIVILPFRQRQAGNCNHLKIQTWKDRTNSCLSVFACSSLLSALKNPYLVIENYIRPELWLFFLEFCPTH